jgi:hypothetical protein
MALNPPLTPTLRRDMVEVVATGTFTYLNEFTRELFPDYATPEVQSLIVDGVAQALLKYESVVGVPIMRTLALTLLDNKEST